jgi:hypothetical protein
MTSSVVSVRMPPSLIKELKEFSIKNHFMDVSDEIRYIIKQKMIEKIDPFSFQIQKLKDEIRGEVSRKSQMDRVKFVEELNRLLEELKRG